MRSMRVGFCAAVVAAAGIAVAACGGASPVSGPAKAATPATPKSPIEAIDAAYTTTSTAGSAKISMDASFTGAQLPDQSMGITASGVVDFAHKTGDVTMNLMGMDMEMRYIDNVEYMHAPSQLLGKDTGKPWIKIDMNEAAKEKLGASMDQLTSGQPSDPTQILSYLRGMGTVTDKGPATVDGTPTERYQAELNVADLAKKENLTADQEAMMEKVLGDKQVPMQLWIDQQNRLRQMSYSQSMDLGALGGASTGPDAGAIAMQMTMKLSDFGTPVTVTAPPADQTQDALAELHAGGK